MDEQTQEFLENAGLAEYIDIFNQNKIGFLQIEEITQEVLPILIGPIGDQLRFQKARAFLQSQVIMLDDGVVIRNSPLQELDVVHTEENEINLSREDSGHSPARKKARHGASAIGTEQEQDAVQIDENQRDVPRENYDRCPAKKTRDDASAINTKEELKDLLNDSNDGQMVLSFYKKNGKLNEATRKKLTTVVVNHSVLIHGQNLTNKNHNVLSDLIAELFPTENKETYYIPPCAEGPKQSISKGKLPYKHRNIKRFMREKGLISPKKSATASQVPETVATIDNLLPEQQLSDVKTWLKSYAEPWTEVLELWGKTAPNRVWEFKTKNTTVTVTHILNGWPLYKHPCGYTLINIDFKVLHEGKELGLINNWASSTDSLISIIKERTKADKQSTAGKLLENISSEISGNGQDAVVMFLLPTVLQPSIIREKNKTWKPTIGEAQDTFVVYVKDSPSMQLFLHQKKKKFEKDMRSIQPYVVIVGEQIETAEDFYVLFENVSYRMTSVLAAVDTCFKVFHVMNLAYPPEAYNTWVFIQRHFFKLTIPREKIPICVTSLISEL